MHTHTHTFTQGHTALACRWHLGMLKLFCLLRGTDELVSCEPAAAAKSLQSCLTLCDPRDGSPPGSPVPGILQGRTLEWVLVSLGLGLKTNPRHSSLGPREKKKKPFVHRHLMVLLPHYSLGFVQDQQVSSVQTLSCVRLFVTLWTEARQASLSFPKSQSLLELMPINSVMPSNHLILCRPLLLKPLIFPSIRVFSNESVLRIRWPKYWSFSFNLSLSNEYSGLISFKIESP